ncbi:Rha family transcriptional regulator [Lactobacillus delbrueckii]|uniref:Rha family transcriptional regulator n=1 Tax=Lactobacillus delbrueckii TaxID=1584 RepID=UPI00177DA2F7|nr:Rha family transcriptional regulator [Lactobacillus delbrueckii]MBD5834748.1 phage regulatory protein [Lactobacillus delbrueckii]
MENQLVIMHDQQAVTTSLKVAEVFGKKHRNVMQSIKNLTAENSAVKKMFVESTYLNSRGQEWPMFYMNRDGFTLLAMGFSGTKAMGFKLKYIEAFNAMESAINNMRPIDKLRLMFEVTDDHEKRLTNLEQNQSLNPGEYGYIGKLVSKKVAEYLATHDVNHGQPANKDQKKSLFKDVNGEVKKATGVSTRTALKERHFKQAERCILAWTPSTATKLQLEDEADEQASLFE